jgi:hypothetical protein
MTYRARCVRRSELRRSVVRAASALYTLQGTKPVRATDLIRWARWFERPRSRFIASDTIGGTRVATIFTGVDACHGLSPSPPVLFENALIDAGGKIHVQGQYRTWKQAMRSHHRLVAALRARQDVAAAASAQHPWGSTDAVAALAAAAEPRWQRSSSA